MPSYRRYITKLLTEASIDYLSRLNYSAFREIGFVKRGKHRADVLAINLKGQLVAHEIKSGISDYRSDKKKWSYRKYCNSFYFIFAYDTYMKHRKILDTEAKANNCGIMILSPKTGYLKAVVKCRKAEVETEIARILTIRLAWRAGESKRTRVRRTRRFITAPI